MVACTDIDTTKTTEVATTELNDVDIEKIAEEFIKIVKKGQFLNANDYYKKEIDGLSKENLQELRELMVVELDKYLENLDEEIDGDRNKSNRMLAAVEFIKMMGFQDQINGILNDYKKRADETIEQLDAEEKKEEEEKSAKIEKEKEEKEKQAKVEEEKKKQEEEKEQAKIEEEKEKQEEEKAQAKIEEQKKEKEVTETNSQQQAVKMAQSYIDYTAFSRSGLIDQLQFEGFNGEDATYAVDKINVDWRAQAVKMAQSYLDYTAFSKSGLTEQLKFEGFSDEDAAYAVNEVGL